MTDGRHSPAASRRASIVRYKMELRKAIRKNAGAPEVNFLNITAMLDMMTIILVFLLERAWPRSSASIPQSKDMTLPTSIITSEPAQEGTTVVISKTQILVGDDPHPVVLLPSRDSLAQSGIDAKYKRNGPNDLYIVPLANALQSARQTDKQIRQAKGLDAELVRSDRHRRHHDALPLAHRGALHARAERVRQVPPDGALRRQQEVASENRCHGLEALRRLK